MLDRVIEKRHIKVAFDRYGVGIRIVLFILLALFALVCVLPFVLTIVLSFSASESIIEKGYTFFPSALTIKGYALIFQYPLMILNSYKTSIIVSFVGTFVSVVISVMVAYPLSQIDFKFKMPVSFFIFFTMIFSGGIVPYYILVTKYLKLADNILALIIPQLAPVYYIFLLRVFMQQLPKELYESARIDGASEFTILTKITVPLSKPGIATIALFTLLMYWNDVFTAQLFISSDRQDLYPIQYLLYTYESYINFIKSGEASASGIPLGNIQLPSEAMLYALCVVAAGPMVFAFMFFQRYFVEGLTMGALKS